MNDYVCDKCGKKFKQKLPYNKHLSRKTTCAINFDIIGDKEIISIDPKNQIKDLSSQEINIIKPILKWVGGKSQIIDKLIVFN